MSETPLTDILEALRLGKGRPSGAEHDPDGKTGILRLGTVDYDDRTIDWGERMRVTDYEPGSHHFLRNGDILIVGRGSKRTAFLVKDPPARTVADRTFFVARPDPDQIVPAFLAWYLNERRAQHYLQSHSRGTNIQTIKKPCRCSYRRTTCRRGWPSSRNGFVANDSCWTSGWTDAGSWRKN